MKKKSNNNNNNNNNYDFNVSLTVTHSVSLKFLFFTKKFLQSSKWPLSFEENLLETVVVVVMNIMLQKFTSNGSMLFNIDICLIYMLNASFEKKEKFWRNFSRNKIFDHYHHEDG